MNTTRRHRPTTPAEREQRDQERQEKLERLHAQLVDQVAALVDGTSGGPCSASRRGSTTTRPGTSC
jgi:hypothetical protein